MATDCHTGEDGPPISSLNLPGQSPAQAPQTGDDHDLFEQTKSRVPVACTMCRSQHLRCDAAVPTCSRCRAGNKRCIYTTMRRRRQRLAELTDSMPTASQHIRNKSFEDVLPPSATGPSAGQPDEAEQPSPNGGTTFSFQPVSSLDESNSVSSRVLDGFYSHFHPGHPFVQPKLHLTSRLEREPESVTDLLSVMKLIGSMYMHDGRSQKYREEVEQALAKSLPRNGFTVQFLLLFAATLEWSGESEKAVTVLNRAKTVALAMGMNRQAFAKDHGQGCAVLEESWRRTWWELYIIDALFAGIRHLPTFSLWSVDHDTDLPCEEESYMSSRIPRPRALHEYSNREFQDIEDSFSSFTYLIDAARILGTSLAAGDVSGNIPSLLVKNAEANIMSWDLYLPHSKRDPIRADGSVDEIMFRAHMVINTVSTHLHRPRSMLQFSTMELLCSKYAAPLPAEILAPEEERPKRHTFEAIRSAKATVDLFTVSVSPLSHSPFIMCMGSLAMATHLSACEHILRGAEFAHARDRVRVFLGILKAFESVWPQAVKWSSEIKLMAKAVFENHDSRGNPMFMDWRMPQTGEPVPSGSSVDDMQVSSGALDSNALLQDTSHVQDTFL